MKLNYFSLHFKMAMVEPTASTTGFPSTLGDKLTIIENDPFSVTFCIRDEDHTLGNSLRWQLMKNPEVLFCGYSIPHPSEYSISIRIQTKTITAREALDNALDQLILLCEIVKSEFKEANK
jgi:DNA-directed RNA polymerase I and III subunit RPAC2